MAASSHMFLVSIDVLALDYDGVKLISMLRSSALFEGWWHHIPGCFLVTTHGTADQVVDEFRTVSGGAKLLAMEVNPAHSEGSLPRQSWEWIRRREAQPAEPEHL